MAQPEIVIEAKGLVMFKDKAKEQQRDAILQLYTRIERQKGGLKKLTEDLTDKVEALPEFKTVEELATQLEIAREKLKLACLENGEINNLKENIALERVNLRALEAEFTKMLLLYTAGHNVQSLDTGAGEQRQIVFKGKIGKKLNRQQELPL